MLPHLISLEFVMKLINEEMKGQKFNINGQDVEADEKGIIELEDREAAKSLCSHAGFKLLRGKASLDVEPPKKDDAPIDPIILDEEMLADLEAEAELSETEEEEEALPESELTEEDLPAPAPKEEKKQPEAKPNGKWLPGKNNKNK